MASNSRNSRGRTVHLGDRPSGRPALKYLGPGFFFVSDGMGVSGVAKDFSRLWNRNGVQHCLDLGLSPFSWVVWLPFPVMGGLWHCFNHIIWNIFGKIGTHLSAQKDFWKLTILIPGYGSHGRLSKTCFSRSGILPVPIGV